MKLSVILCTHNPRADYLEKVIAGLREQRLFVSEWELLIIDNASDRPLSNLVNLGWHPSARCISEEELGLTYARLRGIREAQGEVLVFVDDDNVLRSDYLDQALAVAEAWPRLGAWSGRVVPLYELPPSQELTPYLSMLCIRDVRKDAWGNSEHVGDHTPWGAGMCLRHVVAERYAREAAGNVRKTSLGRRGSFLGSTEDIDIAMTSLDLDMGTGVFQNLELQHLISEKRVSREYFLQLIEDTQAGQVVFEASRGKSSSRGTSRVDALVKFYKRWRATPFERDVDSAKRRGRKRGEAVSSMYRDLSIVPDSDTAKDEV